MESKDLEFKTEVDLLKIDYDCLISKINSIDLSEFEKMALIEIIKDHQNWELEGKRILEQKNKLFKVEMSSERFLLFRNQYPIEGEGVNNSKTIQVNTRLKTNANREL